MRFLPGVKELEHIFTDRQEKQLASSSFSSESFPSVRGESEQRGAESLVWFWHEGMGDFLLGLCRVGFSGQHRLLKLLVFGKPGLHL